MILKVRGDCLRRHSTPNELNVVGAEVVFFRFSGFGIVKRAYFLLQFRLQEAIDLGNAERMQ